jgi:hypothetical protein
MPSFWKGLNEAVAYFISHLPAGHPKRGINIGEAYAGSVSPTIYSRLEPMSAREGYTVGRTDSHLALICTRIQSVGHGSAEVQGSSSSGAVCQYSNRASYLLPSLANYATKRPEITNSLAGTIYLRPPNLSSRIEQLIAES